MLKFFRLTRKKTQRDRVHLTESSFKEMFYHLDYEGLDDVDIPDEVFSRCAKSRNGYFREFTLDAIIAKKRLSCFASVLGLTHDHVPKIREKAYRQVEMWLQQLSADVLIAILPKVVSLITNSFYRYPKLLDGFFARAQALGMDVVAIAFQSSDGLVKRAMWNLQQSKLNVPAIDLFKKALALNDIQFLQWSVSLTNQIDVDDLKLLLAQINTCRSLALKREVLKRLIRANQVSEAVLWTEALWHKSISVRQLVRFVLRDQSDQLNSVYVEALSESSNATITHKKYALEGLDALKSQRAFGLIQS